MTDSFATGNQSHNIKLGIDGFYFSDLFDAVKLRELAEKFYSEIKDIEPTLHSALTKYIAARGENYERKVESKILTDAAPFLSDFIGRLFRIESERRELGKAITVQNPVWKFKFFVQRRAIKRYKADQIAEMNENELWIGLTELRNAGFYETLVRD